MNGSKRNLAELFARFDDAWSPKVAGAVDDYLIKVVKLRDEFHWHAHANEDEMFLVFAGVMRLEFRDRHEHVGPGEFIVVPKGVEHRPCAQTDEVCVVLFERASVINTGDGPDTDRTVRVLDQLR